MKISELLEQWKVTGLNGLFSSEDEYGNNLVILATDETLEVKTLQHNGWIERVIYYKNGDKEVLYER